MLNLQDLAKQNRHQQTIVITQRLPAFMTGPCTLNVDYLVESKDDYYMIQLHVQGDLNIICQRCLEEFAYSYDNTTQIVVCSNDARADQLLEQYECIVAANLKVELEDLVIDELHLYAPQFHPDINECSSAIQQILKEKNETF